VTTFYGAEAAVEAVLEFLQDGNASSNTYDQELADLRTDKGITTAELPDVASYEAFYPRELQARSFPHMSIVYTSDSAEIERNSRMTDFVIELRLTVLDQDIAGAEVEMGQAMSRYRDALNKLFFRRTGGGQGWTLNNGGTGDAKGRVILAKITSNVLTFDPELMGANSPNMQLRSDLLCRLEEDY